MCPGRKCGKCRRMLSRVEEAVGLSETETSVTIIDSLEEILKHSTWILPTLVINDKVVARGYVPPLQQLLDLLNDASANSSPDSKSQK
ncbi:MAG: thioredoxin family protein [Bacteroidales bacterium]